MDAATDPATLPSFESMPGPVTPGMPLHLPRLGMMTGMLAIAAGAGALTALTSRRRGLAIGGVAAVVLGALRWQLARWFTATPAYEVEARIGGLEIRRYPLRIEARTATTAPDLDRAVDASYGRLACYVYGANAAHEDLERTTPVLTARYDGTYVTSFVMPPGRALGSLPRPDDSRIELREVPPRRIAVRAFAGACTRASFEAHERELLRALVGAGIAARGGVTFACYDSPATLPSLRRSELWIEID